MCSFLLQGFAGGTAGEQPAQGPVDERAERVGHQLRGGTEVDAAGRMVERDRLVRVLPGPDGVVVEHLSTPMDVRGGAARTAPPREGHLWTTLSGGNGRGS